MNRKIQYLAQNLRDLKKHNVIHLFFIVIGVVLLIVPYTFVPLINTEHIWSSPSCYYEPWFCPFYDYFTLPNNDLIQNKYDVIVFGSPAPNLSFSLNFEHIETGREYLFNYTLTIEEYIIKETFSMIPGKYRVSGDLYLFHKEMWEHGIIPPGFESLYYIGFAIISTIVVLIGNIGVFLLRKKYQTRSMNLKMRE